MYDGYFVNSDLLCNGIYLTYIPNIRDKNTTIESMVNQALSINEHADYEIINKAYFDNLKKCELVEVELNFKEVANASKN